MDQPRRRVLVSGAGGLIGRALCGRLLAEGFQVVALTRFPGKFTGEAIPWEPREDRLDPAALEGFDAIIHLAGEPITGRWTAEKKSRIRDSRALSTELLARHIATLRQPPRYFFCASATGFYGNCGEKVLTEASPCGDSFLSMVCREWEAACQPARHKGVLVTSFRFGLTLSPRGGALRAMLPAFRMGLGGKIGSGQQWMNWIHLDDAVGAIIFALNTSTLPAALNAVAPAPLRNEDFSRTLAAILHRPALIAEPVWALRLMLGEMADALLLASCRAEPAGLLSLGYQFKFPTLEEALRDLFAPAPSA